MNQLTEYRLDVLRELINIGIGRAAGVLNEMVSATVTLQVPHIKVLGQQELRQELEGMGGSRIAAVRLSFSGPFSGTAALVFPPDSASKLVAVLTGEEPGSPELDSVRAGTLSEVGNIVINGVMGSVGNILGDYLSYSLPSYVEDTLEGLLGPAGDEMGLAALLVRTRFTISQLQVEGDVLLVFGMGSFDALLASIDRLKKA